MDLSFGAIMFGIVLNQGSDTELIKDDSPAFRNAIIACLVAQVAYPLSSICLWIFYNKFHVWRKWGIAVGYQYAADFDPDLAIQQPSDESEESQGERCMERQEGIIAELEEATPLHNEGIKNMNTGENRRSNFQSGEDDESEGSQNEGQEGIIAAPDETIFPLSNEDNKYFFWYFKGRWVVECDCKKCQSSGKSNAIV